MDRLNGDLRGSQVFPDQNIDVGDLQELGRLTHSKYLLLGVKVMLQPIIATTTLVVKQFGHFFLFFLGGMINKIIAAIKETT